jgi:hypothetical protein
VGTSARDANDRRFEGLKALLRDRGGDFGSRRAAQVTFIQHHEPAGALNRGEDRGLIQRNERARIDHFDVDAKLSQFRRRLQRHHHHVGRCHQGYVATTAADLSLAEHRRVCALGHRALDAEQLGV